MNSFAQQHKIFIILSCLFIALLVVSDVIGGKTITYSSLQSFDIGSLKILPIISVGIIPFMAIFVLTDLINEFYGTHNARFISIVALCINILILGILKVSTLLPAYNHSVINDQTFNIVFNQSMRIMIASNCAFLISQFLDIYIFQIIKKYTQSKFLWLRMTGSTAISQLIDSFIITYIAYYQLMQNNEIVSLASNNYIIKLFIVILLTPVCYGAYYYLKKLLFVKS